MMSSVPALLFVAVVALVSVLTTTTVQAELFAQLECTDSSCKDACTSNVFTQGMCYKMVAGGSAISYCGSSSLKIHVFPFTLDCTEYTQESVVPLGTCTRGAENFVEYMCQDSSSDASSSSLFSNNKKKNVNNAATNARRQVPMVFPDDAKAIVNKKTLAGVEMLHGGNTMKINVKKNDDKMASTWYSNVVVDVLLSQIALDEKETPVLTPIARLENAVGAMKVLSINDDATSMSVELDVLRLYLGKLLSNKTPMQAQFVVRGTDETVLKIRL